MKVKTGRQWKGPVFLLLCVAFVAALAVGCGATDAADQASKTSESSGEMIGQSAELVLPSENAAGQSGESIVSSNSAAGQTEESFVSSDSASGQSEDEGKPARIGITVYSLQNAYMKRFIASASETADALGVELLIYDGNYDAGLQVTQVREMLAHGIDGLLLNPEDAEACVECVDLAADAGIPVISVNTRVNSDRITSYVGSDDREAGRLLMQELADALGGSGNVVILEGPLGQSAETERLEGMREVLRAAPELRVISCKTANWSRLEAESVMAKWLGLFDTVDAVAAENDDMALGALDAIDADVATNDDMMPGASDAIDTASMKNDDMASAAHNADDVAETGGSERNTLIAGIDGSAEAAEAVRAGRMTATVFQNAEEQGETAVTVMRDLLAGEEIETEYNIPLEVIRGGEQDISE